MYTHSPAYEVAVKSTDTYPPYPAPAPTLPSGPHIAVSVELLALLLTVCGAVITLTFRFSARLTSIESRLNSLDDDLKQIMRYIHKSKFTGDDN